MLKSQKKYLDYLQEVELKLNSLEITETIRKSFFIKELKQSIKEKELLIPVIGAFSSGKSSLINSFLEKEYLPVGITPETALATELRYADDGTERIEAVKADLTFDIFNVEEIGTIGKNAAQYKFIKLFISNKKLLDIQPLILVDMPGFDSPLDLHNQAIMEYIDKGVHYIVLTSVEDGTITRSMIRQLEDIKEYRRGFSFFISKSNLRSEEEVIAIKNVLQQEISDNLNLDKPIYVVDDNGGNSLKQVLNQADPESLFKSLFITDLKTSYYSISESINTYISSLKRSKGENEQAIKELQQSLESIITERNRMLEDAKEKYSDTNVNYLVDNIGRELTNNIDELVTTVIAQGQDGLEKTISSIIRHSLISGINETMSEIGNEIVEMFSLNLSKISETSSEFVMSDDFIKKISDGAKDLLIKTQGFTQDLKETHSESKVLYKAITTVLAITTEVLAPVVEVLIVFLPDILEGIIQSLQRKRREEKVRNLLLTSAIPSIKRKLRENLSLIFNKQVEDLINNISTQFENEIAKKKEAINSAQEELKEKTANIDGIILNYSGILSEIKALANAMIF